MYKLKSNVQIIFNVFSKTRDLIRAANIALTRRLFVFISSSKILADLVVFSESKKDSAKPNLFVMLIFCGL